MTKKKTTKTAVKKKTSPAARKLDYIAEALRPLAVPIGELVLDPENARTHGDENIAAIAASLAEFGQLKPVVANRQNGQLVAGNGTLLAAGRLGWSHLAVVFGEYDESSARGFAIADNRTAELAGWDAELLLQQSGLIEQELPDLAVALQLAELQQSLDRAEEAARPDAEAQGGNAEAGTGEELGDLEYRIIVLCRDEPDQVRLLKQFEEEGIECRALIS